MGVNCDSAIRPVLRALYCHNLPSAKKKHVTEGHGVCLPVRKYPQNAATAVVEFGERNTPIESQKRKNMSTKGCFISAFYASVENRHDTLKHYKKKK